MAVDGLLLACLLVAAGRATEMEGKGIAKEFADHSNIRLLNPEGCGRSPSSHESPLTQVPWMALLAYNTSRGVIYSCGGTVINSRYVLTAAHCVRKLPMYTKLTGVRLGEYDLTTAVDCEVFEGRKHCNFPRQDVAVEKVLVHSGYNEQSLRHDIALLRLNKTIGFKSGSIRPICLPLSVEEQSRWFHEGELLTVIGWGTSSTGVQNPVVQLKQVEFVAARDCVSAYQNLAGRRRITISDEQLCLRGSASGDATNGDGGGPLVAGGFDRLDEVTQYGIVSFGPRSGVRDPPGVYTRVASYIRWILDRVGDQQ